MPTLHTFVSNRVTKYEGQPSKAFNAMIKAMKTTIDGIHAKHRMLSAVRPRDQARNSYLSPITIALLSLPRAPEPRCIG